MFCASPVLLNLTVIKCRLGLIKWLLWLSFAQSQNLRCLF